MHMTTLDRNFRILDVLFKVSRSLPLQSISPQGCFWLISMGGKFVWNSIIFPRGKPRVVVLPVDLVLEISSQCTGARVRRVRAVTT